MGSRHRLARRLAPALAALLVAACGSNARQADPLATAPTQVSRTAWSVIALPRSMQDRAVITFAQIDDTHALAFGGNDSNDGRPLNDGVVVDLTTGASTNLDGPDVGGSLARTTAATETGAAVVAVAGLQCAKFDPQYRTEDDATTDPCPPGPVTLALYDAAADSWSRPSDAPYDYGQAFIPKIIGFVDGRVYVEVDVYTPGAFHSDYIRYDVATQLWTRIAAPPHPLSACLGEGRVIGLVYDGDALYSNPRVVTYDPATDRWSPHRVPGMPSTRSPYGRTCAEHAVIVNDSPLAGRPAQWSAYSLADGSWTQLPSSPVRLNLGSPRASAGDAFVVWNEVNVPAVDHTSSLSLTVGPDAKWSPRVPPPAGHAGHDIGLGRFAHAGTHIMSVDDRTIITADLAHLAEAR